jgi:hypothetical protein
MKHFCSIKNEHLLLTLFTGTTSAQRKLAAASLRRAVRQSGGRRLGRGAGINPQ